MKFVQVILAGVLVVLMMGATCNNVRPPPIAIEPEDTHNCAAACTKLQELGCPEGDPLPDGTTCTKFCEDTQQSGHPLNPTCVMGMSSCDELPGCTNPR
jgi:hypothetical protein